MKPGHLAFLAATLHRTFTPRGSAFDSKHFQSYIWVFLLSAFVIILHLVGRDSDAKTAHIKGNGAQV